MTAILVVLATLYCFGYLLPTSLPLLQSPTSEAAEVPLTSSIWTLSGPGGIRGKKEEKEAKKLCRITVAMVKEEGLCRPCSKLVVGDRMALAHVLMQ